MAKTGMVLLLPRLFLLLVTLALPSSGDDDVNLQSLMTLVQQQAASIQSLQARVVSLETSGHQAAGTVQQHVSQLAALTARVNNQVYFNAHMSQYTISIDTGNAPVKFDAVVTNIGNSYNPLTGVFTAPTSGVYVFNAQMMKYANIAEAHYVIEKNGVIICLNAMDTGNAYDKSSCLAPTHVQQGETVFVRRSDGTNIVNGGWFCAFSGFLLAPDAN